VNLVELIQPWAETLRDLPALVLVLSAIPLMVLAWAKRIYPYRMLIYLFAVPCCLTVLLLIPQQSLPQSLASLFKKDSLSLIVAADLAVIAIAIWDLFSLPRRRAFSAERECQHIASLQQHHTVTVSVDNRSSRAYRVWIRDDAPNEFEAVPDEFCLNLQPMSRSRMRYQFTPHQRGSFELRKIYFRCRSGLGLWQRFLDYPSATTVNVYPDMRQLSKYAVLARTNRLSLMGVRRARRIGQDNEFERLRDYTPDDNYKHIDWRSTARRRKLTVCDYQTNQSQRVMFLVDCGRMMTNTAEGISLLDHALNAVLMLSFVALRQGDAVGMIGFSDRIHSYVPPRGGASQMNRLLHASFDRFPELVESRYDQAFSYLGTHAPKRSLVILISNVIDDVNSNQIQRHLSTLVGRHLPLGVLLRDHQLFDAAESPPLSNESAFRAAAAAEILTWRHQVLRDLEHQGVLALDVFPEDLASPLVNKYLEIKARHLL
jgi:uncharacterized protein (DUF58 family)